jgi:hypothetical protein
MKLDQAINEELERAVKELPEDKWLDRLIEKFPLADVAFLLEMVMIESGGDCIANDDRQKQTGGGSGV